MRPNKLFNLVAKNAKQGSFRSEGNTIFLYDVIMGSDAEVAYWGCGVSPEAFARMLAGMKGAVDLRINSPGGEVFAAVAMAQAMRQYDGPVIAHVDGIAASAASTVAVSADKTIMAPGSMLMIHNAWSMALGNAADFRQTADVLEKIDGEIAAGYTRKSGTDTDFAALMATETWLTAKEAIALGLADSEAVAEPKTQNKWDLTVYDRAPAPTAENDVTVTVTVEIEDEDDEADTPGETGDAAEAAATLAETNDTDIEHRTRQLTARLLLQAA